MLLLDVLPLSIGVETMGGVMTKMIERNTVIPTRRTEIYSTASDNQTTVEIHVLQGEREMSRDNKSIGRFTLGGISPAPRGVPQIELSFDVDANGIVTVSASDLATGRNHSITINDSSSLEEEEIEEMIEEARRQSEHDRKAKKEAEDRNRCAFDISNANDILSARTRSENELEEIERWRDNARIAMKMGKIEQIRHTMLKLENAINSSGEDFDMLL